MQGRLLTIFVPFSGTKLRETSLHLNKCVHDKICETFGLRVQNCTQHKKLQMQNLACAASCKYLELGPSVAAR